MDKSPTEEPIRVLAIDDHQHILDLIRDIFRNEGYIFESERSAVDALYRLQKEPDFDVILLDMMLPGMDGFAFLKKVQANPKTAGLRIIMVTAMAETTMKTRAFAAGAADYLVKPFESQELISCVRTQAHLKRAEEAVKESMHRYQLLAEHSVDAVWQMDLAFNFLYVNPAIETILGYTVSEWLASNLQQHCSPLEFQKARRLLLAETAQQQTPSSTSLEINITHKEKRSVPVEIRGNMFLDENGRPAGFQGILRDISARKVQQQTRNQLAAVIEQAQETVIITDLEGNIVYANPFFQNSSGYDRHAVQGKNPRFLKSGLQDKQFYRQMWETISAGEAWHGRFINNHSDGHTYHEEATIFPIRDEKGEIINYAAVKRDITAQIIAEEALNRSLKTYSALFEQSQDGIILSDLNGRQKAINPACSRLLGYTDAELIGKSFNQLLVDEERTASEEIFEELLAGEIIAPYIRNFRTKSGQVIPVELTVMLVYDEHSQPLMIQSILRDMREKYRAQQALQKYAERLRVQHTIDREILSPQPISQMITRGLLLLHELIPCRQLSINLLNLNQQKVTIFAVVAQGKTLTPANYTYPISANFQEEFGPFDKFRYMPDLAQVQPKPPLLTHYHSRGILSIAAIPMAAGKELLGHLVMAADQTDAFDEEQLEIAGEIAPQFALAIRQARYRQQIREQTQMLEARVIQRTQDLRLANAELARAARVKDEFLANMSHELRTPLSAILGKAEVLQEGIYGQLTPKQQRAAAIIEGSGHQLLSLINDILDIAKIEAGKFELEFMPITVQELCQSSINLIKQPANKKQLRIHLEQDERISQFVADGRRLKQALVNLLSNAVKFTPEQGEIGLRVTCSDDLSNICFHIWDTGIGIPAEKIDELFKPFVQLDSSLSRLHEGTGLGLSLVEKLIILHDGTLTISSAPGAGSEFTISLPLQAGQKLELPESTAASWKKLQERWQRPLKIMLVAENPQNSRLFPEYWSQKGFVVFSATYGSDIMQQFRDNSPDILLVDLQATTTQGVNTIREIRQLITGGETPILAIADEDDGQDPAQSLDAGANYFLPNPATPAQLLQKMLTLFNGITRGPENAISE